MAALAIYQRTTGPTYPKTGNITIDKEKINYELLTSFGGEGNAPVKLIVKDRTINGKIKYRRYKSYDTISTVALSRIDDTLTIGIPHQPPAGKVEYEIILSKDGKEYPLRKDPVIIRFKGHVPEFFLIPHIIFMFSAMWFSLRTGFEALAKGKNVYKLTIATTLLFFFGGIIMGPIIQMYAFGALWTGWPFGHDLTDNKTLVAFIMWLVALWKLKKNPEMKGWAIAAAAVLLAVYLIPHSVLGSEIDYSKGM
jgi:hypothetical protein